MNVRAVPYSPAHHLNQIGHIIGKTHYIYVIDAQKVKALHCLARPDHDCQHLTAFVQWIIKYLKRLDVPLALVAGYAKEPERHKCVTSLYLRGALVRIGCLATLET